MQCAGDVIDVPDDEGRRMIADQQALIVETKIEQATGRRAFENPSGRRQKRG